MSSRRTAGVTDGRRESKIMTTGESPDSATTGAAPEAELDGPAEENDEMRRGTSDLQSSQEKSAEAKEIAADLRGSTLPETTER